MKEFPKFDYNGVSYDLCFYDDSVQLYAVQNKFSGVMVSQLIPAANDYVAITGFKNFLDKQRSENDAEVYSLIRFGTFNVQKIEIQDVERIEIIDSRADIDKWLKDAQNFMLSWSDEE